MLPCRANQDGGRCRRILFKEFLTAGVIPHETVLTGIHKRDFILIYQQTATLRRRDSATDDKGSNPKLHQVLARLPTDIGLLDASGEWTLATN